MATGALPTACEHGRALIERDLAGARPLTNQGRAVFAALIGSSGSNYCPEVPLPEGLS
jgi:hypothetical protein